jgi:hypothetical protein
VVTLTRARIESFEAAKTVANRILGENPFPRVFELLYIHPDDVHASLETFRQYDDHDLSFTDASITMRRSHDATVMAAGDGTGPTRL